VTAAGPKLPLGNLFVIATNDWYLAPGGPVTPIFKARHGIIQEIGIAQRQLTIGRTAQRTFLTSFHPRHGVRSGGQSAGAMRRVS
jgi:hypothetical protein